MFAIAQYLDAIDENVTHARGILVRLLVGGMVLNTRWVEDDHVRKVSLLQASASLNSEIVHGQRSKPTNRFFERNHLFVAHVFAKQARESAVSARMRIRLQESPFRRERGRIGIKTDPRQLDLFPDVLLRHQEINGA